MKLKQDLKKCALLGTLLMSLYGCSFKNKKKDDSSKTTIKQDSVKLSIIKVTKTSSKDDSDDIAQFERKIYLKIDQIYTGKVYISNNKSDVFYRVLVIPEEENIMLLAEQIQVMDDESGNLKLVRLARITDVNSALPKFGLGIIDSLKFKDSVTIQGYFNKEKKTINLDEIKNYKISE